MTRKKSVIRAVGSARVSAFRQRDKQQINSHDSSTEVSSHDTQRLTHELQVHQIELERQNEVLQSAQYAIETALARYTDLYDFALTGYFTLNRRGDICQTNVAGARLLGIDRSQLSNLNFRLFVRESDLLCFNKTLNELFEDETRIDCEVMLVRNDQSRVPVQIVATLSSDKQECRAEVRDITLMKEHQQQLEHIAHYDALTNLPNRVLLADRIRHAMDQCKRRNQSMAVAYLDIDGFKGINDHHGHKIGDELLITLSKRMKAALRGGDTLARIGGDEFIALLVDLETESHCEPMLDRLLLAASSPVRVGSSTLQVSASIGVTLHPKDCVDTDHLIRHADQAMVIAKQTGKNRYHLFDVDRDASAKSHREDMERIERALEQDEFVPYYQPKVNMKTGDVIGAELLTYWQHPDRGLLAPGTYLPIIENYPISVELGDWVIDSALAQLSEWQAVGLQIPLSVNIDAVQLQEPDFAIKLSNALARYPEVNPQFLELEILETSALEDITQVSGIMHACRELGVGFALDDFGTGFSSLTYLKRLPADMLKIDRSFIQNILHDPDDRAIVIGVIGLADAFQRQVIAEGVESIAHGTQLLAMGCVLAQGFGIARPMLAIQMPQWVANWRPDKAWKR